MKIKDIDIVASLLCQEGVELSHTTCEKIGSYFIVFFWLKGKSEDDFKEMIARFMRYELKVDARMASERKNLLKDIIFKDYGFKPKRQLSGGKWEAEKGEKDGKQS